MTLWLQLLAMVVFVAASIGIWAYTMRGAPRVPRPTTRRFERRRPSTA